MLKDERYDKILEILAKEKYVSAQELAKRLFVSLPTIRRDLAELQKGNRIIRSHGGAKLVDTEHVVAPLNFRTTVNFSEKRQLCRAAAEFIDDSDVIFIDSSTTTLQMADFLDEKKNIIAITNGITLASLLVKKGIKTFCTGGEIFENSLAHFGSFAEDFIEKFNIDKLFFSCYGINEKGVLTDPSLPETQIRKVAINCSKKTFFLCNETKFSLSAPYNLIHINKLDYIITDTDRVDMYLADNDDIKIIKI